MKGKHTGKLRRGKSYSLPNGGKDKMANKTVRSPSTTKSDLEGLGSGYNPPKGYKGSAGGHNVECCD